MNNTDTTQFNEQSKDDYKKLYDYLTGSNKPFSVNQIRKLIQQYDKEEISLSKFTESLNETIYYWQDLAPTTPPHPMQGISAAPVSGEGLYRWVKASKTFPTGIQNVKVTSELSGVVMKGVGLFNTPINFSITYLNGTGHGAGEIKLAEIEWLEPLPASEGKMFSIEEVIERVNKYWTFNNEQDHTHSWHDKQQFISSLNKK